MWAIVVIIGLFSFVGYLILSENVKRWVRRRLGDRDEDDLMMRPPPAGHNWSKRDGG